MGRSSGEKNWENGPAASTRRPGRRGKMNLTSLWAIRLMMAMNTMTDIAKGRVSFWPFTAVILLENACQHPQAAKGNVVVKSNGSPSVR